MKTIVCGLGNNAYRTVELLFRLQESVNVITQNQKIEDYLVKKIKQRCNLFIEGDARDEDILKSAEIDSARALLVLTNDDIANLEISIRAKELNPAINIITRQFNEVLCKELEGGFGIKKVLSTSSLASRSFISAAINEETLFALKINAGYFFFESLAVKDNSRIINRKISDIEKKYSIKIIGKKNNDNVFEYFKNDDIISGGEELLFLTSDKNAYKNLTHQNKTLIAQSRKISRDFTVNLLDRIKNISSNVKFVFASYLSLILLSVILFSAGMNLSIIDALYFTIATTTTIGYGDINLLSAPWIVKLLGSFVMLSGAAILASLFSIITEKLISRRFNQYFGFNNIRLKDHIIIAGLGKIGFRVANQLHESGEKVIVIEKDAGSDFLTSLRGKIPVLIGDSAHPQILNKSGLQQAKTIMALTNDDIINLNMLIYAQKVNPGIKTIARIFSKRIGEKAKEAFKIDKVLSVASLASPTIVASALYKNTLGAFFLMDNLYIIFETDNISLKKVQNMTRMGIITKYNLFPLFQVNQENQVISIENELMNAASVILIGEYKDVKQFI
jgi:Trk K+ transport system NAD-binding subunit